MTSKQLMHLMKNWIKSSLVRHEIEIISCGGCNPITESTYAFIRVRHKDTGKKILIKIEEE